MHIPVLLNEVIEALEPKSGERFVDATTNGGGHARAVLEQVGPTGKVLGIEWDASIVEQLRQKLDSEGIENLILINDSYVNLGPILEDNNFLQPNGIVFDLGMSNWHIEDSGKGFSFLRDEKLDMRYDTSNGEAGYDIVNKYSEADLESIIKDYGEERFASRIAREIMKERKIKPIIDTVRMVEVIKNAVPVWYQNGRLHFATKTFQALRIAVNHELENVEYGISRAIENLASGGRIAVITFHSLEDRIVKNIFRDQHKQGIIKLINKKPIVPSREEVTANPKARSAKLRSAIKN